MASSISFAPFNRCERKDASTMAMTTCEVEFTRDGAVFDPQQLAAVEASLGPVTDLLVLSHGWNNDKADASALYDELLGNIDKLLELRGLPGVPEKLQRVSRAAARAHVCSRQNLLAQQEVHRCRSHSRRWRGVGAGRAATTPPPCRAYSMNSRRIRSGLAIRRRIRIERGEDRDREGAHSPSGDGRGPAGVRVSCCARCSIRR